MKEYVWEESEGRRAREPDRWGGEPAPASVLTVSELVLRASNALEAEFGTVGVEGEVSSLTHARSGHLYWTLKDPSSAVECVMYKSDNQRLGFELTDGAHVVVVARPTIYRVRGRFQLTVVQVLPQGRGALYLRLEALREKLAAEGLFEQARKRRLPYWPFDIGVVTSAEGAALRDICTIVARRSPATRILLKPVPVQGREAAPEIARAIRWFARHRVVEVLIVGRGGGSLEDLWAFNEEIVVRAIAESPIPVVSAVGHETDTTLSDFAADLRAATPSAAAEAVVPDTRDIERLVEGSFRRLSRAIERSQARRMEAALAPIRRYGFRRVRDRYREARQRWGEARDALLPAVLRQNQRRIDERLAPLRRYGFRRVRDRAREDRTRWQGAVAALAPAVSAGHDAARLNLRALVQALPGPAALRHERVRTRFGHLSDRLTALNPLAILDRGYAVVVGPDDRAVTDAASLAAGDPLQIRLARGKVGARVTDVEPKPEEAS